MSPIATRDPYPILEPIPILSALRPRILEMVVCMDLDMVKWETHEEIE